MPAAFVRQRILGAALNPARIDYEIRGQGPWLILVHALATSRSLWEPVAALLQARFRILTYDLRGHGASSVSSTSYSLDAFAEDQLALMDELEIPDAHLCGIALGGEIAQVFAARWPNRVNSLALADTVCFAAPHRRAVWDARIQQAKTAGMNSLAPELISRWFSPKFHAQSPQIVARFIDGISRCSVQGFAAAAHAVQVFDLRSRLREIQAPTTVLVGSDDEATPLDAAREIAKHIAGAVVQVIPNAGHFSAVEQPEQFAQCVMEASQRSNQKV